MDVVVRRETRLLPSYRHPEILGTERQQGYCILLVSWSDEPQQIQAAVQEQNEQH